MSARSSRPMVPSFAVAAVGGRVAVAAGRIFCTGAEALPPRSAARRTSLWPPRSRGNRRSTRDEKSSGSWLAKSHARRSTLRGVATWIADPQSFFVGSVEVSWGTTVSGLECPRDFGTSIVHRLGVRRQGPQGCPVPRTVHRASRGISSDFQRMGQEQKCLHHPEVVQAFFSLDNHRLGEAPLSR